MEIEQPAILTDGVVALRPMRESDAAPYAAAFREDLELGVLLGFDVDPDEQAVLDNIAGHPQERAEARAVHFTIADHETDAFWGEVLVFMFNDRHRRCELGFWLVPKQRRRGVGARAVGLAVAWAFDGLGLERVEMTTTPENEAVPALANRLGFRREGVLRGRNLERGRRVDIVWFGLLREGRA